MTPAELSRTVLRAVRRAVEEEVLPAPVPERAAVERTRPGGTGDYASNVALRLARAARKSPREVAEILRERLAGTPGLAAVEVTGPGFLNFTLDVSTGEEVVRELLDRGVVRSDALAVPVPAPDALARLGRDAAVWALLLPAPDTELLAQHERNPLFRVRYAHSRTRALHRNAADLGFSSAYEAAPDARHDAPRAAAHDAPYEAAPEAPRAAAPDVPYEAAPEPPYKTVTDAPELFALLGGYPVELDAAVRLGAPERLARHLVAVADAFLRFHDTANVLPLGDEKPSAAHRSRLAVAEAAGTVLAGGLSQLGISAPDHL
ncbi:ArgS-related anticodon-binding protein NrtL [Streptomyces sp. NPDC048442]|uniref:ArgS-related anticodon-binding protein NrtL n=1 Tax=Streptomyces sp. NPDC048442 TaxID=3154823 RepID=UPI003438560E